ncbi:MAG: hypothetical protein ACTSUE_26810 [Promethearchaeota archaeon]
MVQPENKTFPAGVKRFFSLEKQPMMDSFDFLLKVGLWIMLFRLVMIAWMIIYPDAKGFMTFMDVQIAPLIGLPGAEEPGNDSFFYWDIALNWFSAPERVNFSPLFPTLLFVSKFALGELSPFILNSLFLVITPKFLLGFLGNVVKDERKARVTCLLIMFNPIFFGYSTFGLTEPLHYLLLFVALDFHYKSGWFSRMVEYSCLVLLVLNRFLGITLAAFYLYKAFFTRDLSLKRRVLLLFPVAFLGATYIGWEVLCSILFGITPSGARDKYWDHRFNFNPLDPSFAGQLPVLISGAVLGIFVLFSWREKDERVIGAEESSFSRIDMQALLAFSAITIIFLGLFNKQISVLRYIGTLFPLFMIQGVRVPTKNRSPFISYCVVTGMVVVHLLTFQIIADQVEGLAISSFERVAFPSLTVSFVIFSMYLYIKRDAIKSINRIFLYQLICCILVAPLAIYYP